jgi:hypothetical protein
LDPIGRINILETKLSEPWHRAFIVDWSSISFEFVCSENAQQTRCHTSTIVKGLVKSERTNRSDNNYCGRRLFEIPVVLLLQDLREEMREMRGVRVREGEEAGERRQDWTLNTSDIRRLSRRGPDT